VALVTGASSGIGAAIAEHLAIAGAKVALAARRAEKLKEVQAKIERQGGVAITTVMDVCDEQQVWQFIVKFEFEFKFKLHNMKCKFASICKYISNCPSNQLLPWSRVLLEKLIVTHLVNKTPTFYGT
jgi:NAD(P)-dependent dehydrogenase (short-subunit alcohol dehydrogenase family)